MQPGDTCERFKISHKTWVSGCRVPALRHVSVHETCGGNLSFVKEILICVDMRAFFETMIERKKESIRMN